VSVDAYGKVKWWVVNNWQWVAFGITALITLVLGPSVWGNIAGSLSATFLFNALVSSWSAVCLLLHRVIGD
jgi:hypothetical protein